MITVNFCRAPSHYWVGWCYYENGCYCAYGTTLDQMLYNIKRTLYTKKRVSALKVFLNTKQSLQEEAPLNLFKQIFKTKYWYPKEVARIHDQFIPDEPKETTVMVKPKPKDTDKDIKYDYYDTKYIDGELVVYGVLTKEVARYKLKQNPFAIPADLTPKVKPFGEPIAVLNGGADGQ